MATLIHRLAWCLHFLLLKDLTSDFLTPFWHTLGAGIQELSLGQPGLLGGFGRGRWTLDDMVTLKK